MKTRLGLLSLALALFVLSLCGCASEPKDEEATPPASSEAGTGKFKPEVQSSQSGTASPFRQSK